MLENCTHGLEGGGELRFSRPYQIKADSLPCRSGFSRE